MAARMIKSHLMTIDRRVLAYLINYCFIWEGIYRSLIERGDEVAWNSSS